MRTQITIQAKRMGEPEEAWKVRNTLREVNASLAGNKRNEQQAVDEATRLMNAWNNSFPQNEIMLRVHIQRYR